MGDRSWKGFTIASVCNQGGRLSNITLPIV
jgi:hypothetical protein